MARNAGVPALAVTYGAHEHGQLAAESPLACVATVAESRKIAHGFGAALLP